MEGTVLGYRYDAGARGKQFLGAALEASDGTVWVLDYGEQSPFHAFAGNRVEVSGEPYTPEPEGQHLIAWGGGRKLGHFRVSSMRRLEPAPDARFVEVGTGQRLRGRFEPAPEGTGESTLSFVTEDGAAYLVANDPPGAKIGVTEWVWAYPLRPGPGIPSAGARYLWITTLVV